MNKNQESLPEAIGSEETGISIPHTPKFNAALERMIDIFEKSALTDEEIKDLTVTAAELVSENNLSAFKTGFDAGIMFAQLKEDDENYIRIDGKYKYIGDCE